AKIMYSGTSTGTAGMAAPDTLSVPFVIGTAAGGATLAKPPAPTAPSHVLAGTDWTLKWTGAAGAVFYRIYRDGQLLQDRYDTCDVGDTGTGGCDFGSNQFAYADTGAGGGHTYWITAVNSSLTESNQVAIP